MKLRAKSGFRERVCPQCKKKFHCWIETWVYTRQPNEKSKQFFCSWSCLQEFDIQRAKEVKQRRRKRKENNER